MVATAFLCLFALFCSSAFSLDWQGHRGARGLYPENTIGSMEEALKYPVTTLELDVVVSKDHKVIASHEPWMSEEICLDPHGKAVRGKEVNLYQLTSYEIVRYDCGSRPHPRFPQQQKVSVGKPRLDTLIDIIEAKLKAAHRSHVGYNIEIKSTPEDEKAGYQPDVKTLVDIVVPLILAKLPPKKFTIQSFDWRVLQDIHSRYPRVRLVALFEGRTTPTDVIKKLGFTPEVFSPSYQDLDRSLVEGFQTLHMKVVPWTVNDVEAMDALIAMKVDGIITDYPNLIPAVIAQKCPKGSNYFQGSCVSVPAHAVPSALSPGWVCKPGYVQKRRKSCDKIVIPGGARLLPDGKNWECKKGYRRYRGSCQR